MYDVSLLYHQIISQDDHWFETSVVIGESGRLITEKGDYILFGGIAIVIAQGNAENGFQDSMLFSLAINSTDFADNEPSVGRCISAELDLTMLRPVAAIPRMALVAPYVRVTDGVDYSEWIPQGKFFIDTRSYSNNEDGLDIVTIHAYDAMLKAEQDYPETTHEWPMSDIDVVREIAGSIGVGVDQRTVDLMTRDYQISLPAGYTMREVLSNIAAMYAGNFVMSYDGELLFVPLNSIPAETDYIITEQGDTITIAGGRLLVHFSEQ